ISEIVQAAVDTTQNLIVNKPVSLITKIEPDLPPLTGDSHRIQQIIINLLSNAYKFTEEGVVKLHVYQQQNDIIIEIEDSGIGIAPENYDLIFEAFRQTKDGLRKGEGTGLGLPISQRLAEAHGGEVWFESTVGQGATFYIALPLDSHLIPTI